MLDGPFLAVRQLDLDLHLLPADTGPLATFRARFRFALTGQLAADRAFLRKLDEARTGMLPTSFAGVWFHRFAIPLGIAEMEIGLYEVIDGEVVLPLEQTGAPADDLLELDHGVYWAHQDDVPNIPCIHAS